MAFKFVPMFALVSLSLAIEGGEYNLAPVVKGEGLTYGYPVQKVLQAPTYKQVEYEQIAPAAYDFNYQVHDEQTGDIKSQKEVRNGDAVQGRYELIDSDGFRRIVEYTADGRNGFNAVVHREPVDIKIPQPIPQDPKLGYAAQIVKDIPVQAYSVNKAAAYAVPQYSAAVRTAPQYYQNPSYVAHANQQQNSVSQSAAVFSTPVHSAALQNPDQAYETARKATPAAPVNLYYRPAFNNQEYSIPSASVNTYTAPTYNTVAYSAPTYSQQAAAVLSNNAYADTFAAYNQKYFSPPAVQAYYQSPAVAKLTYAAPATVAGYTGHINDEVRYNNLVRVNTPSNVGAIQFPQTKSVGSSFLRSTQTTGAASEDSKLDVRSNIVAQQNYSQTQSTESESNNPSSPSYAVSTTPVYKH